MNDLALMAKVISEMCGVTLLRSVAGDNFYLINSLLDKCLGLNSLTKASKFTILPWKKKGG